jgi:hypothetical protein
MLGFDFHHKSLDFAPRLNVFGFLPHSPSSSTSLHWNLLGLGDVSIVVVEEWRFDVLL